MKRCLYSNSLISDFRWKHGPEFTCYPCFETKKTEKANLKAKKRILSEDKTLGVFLLAEGIKKKTRGKVRIKVDRRIIENDLGSHPEDDSKEAFEALLAEGIFYSISFHKRSGQKRFTPRYRLQYGKFKNH